MLSIYLAMVETESEKNLVTELYCTYKQILLNLSMSILHNPADAEDAVQETFIRIINNLSKIDRADSIRTKAFVIIITRNICFNVLKSRKREVSIEDEDTIIDTSDVAQQTEDHIDYETAVENIKKLSPALKDIATLHFVEQFSAEEISEILKMKRSTVYSYIARARKTLLEKQGGNEYDE